jgi:hypothetical protein
MSSSVVGLEAQKRCPITSVRELAGTPGKQAAVGVIISIIRIAEKHDFGNLVLLEFR